MRILTLHLFCEHGTEGKILPLRQHIFNETADNELRHAKVYLKLLTEGGVNTSSLTIDPARAYSLHRRHARHRLSRGGSGRCGNVHGSCKVADEEGFADIADVFRAIASIEMHHKERF